MLQPIFLGLMVLLFACGKDDGGPPDPQQLPVGVWTTSRNEVNLLYAKRIDFASAPNTALPLIEIDAAQTYQTIEGFGYSLTGGSAMLLHQMDAAARAAMLRELFAKSDSTLAVSYLRISIGASDLDPVVFSYDDLPPGQTDPDLLQFNLSRDTLHLIPVLKEILAINPDIRIMGSPWSPPTWMKTNGSSIGGRLKPEYYGAYARYFVKYIQAMAAAGIHITAITPQNEPQHGGNNPSMVMEASEQADFIKNHLGPALASANLQTQIIIWDHNCDRPDYPLAILADPEANPFVHGTAFHLYAGNVSALSTIHDAHPDKGLYFTEQWTGANSSFGDDLMWHMKNVIIGTTRNWSRVALEWNLASDPHYDPHTPGGCTQCKGALTIDGSTVTRNVSYYIIAHASRFVPPGSVRIASSVPGTLDNVAFETPDGKTVLIVMNETNGPQSFNIRQGDTWIATSLHAGTVGTYVW